MQAKTASTEVLPTLSVLHRMRASLAFRVYCFGLGVCVVATVIGLAFVSPLPAAGSVLLLGALFAFAENASVELPNKSSLSASLMLAMVAIVAFGRQSEFLGPV
ncbi:MAG: hypothetical protein WEA75_13550, partial [Acidimicrobiia bacterium]